MLRDETSLPIVAPTMRRSASRTSAISGSGTVEAERDLGPGHVPRRVPTDPDRFARPDAAPSGRLEEQLRAVGLVDEVVRRCVDRLLTAGGGGRQGRHPPPPPPP